MRSFSCNNMTMMKQVFVVMLFLALTSCNKMDPHVYPSKGPFFEGWYMRIIDKSQNVSVGWLFGLILPTPSQSHSFDPCVRTNSCKQNWTHPLTFVPELQASKPLAMSTLLFNPGPNQKLQTFDGVFLVDQYRVTKNGLNVTKNPDDATPPSFEVKISNNVSFVVRPNGTTFSVNIGNAIVKGETTSPKPWGPGGEGPEMWLEKLPFEIHWFVYSLRSTVTKYEYHNLDTGLVVKGGSHSGDYVVAHMEKNWGKTFPKAWVWAEGVNPAGNISFAISSGVITELGVDIKADLSGYRNPEKGISCSFHPLNSIHTLSQDGCKGKATLKVTGVECSVTFEMFAEMGSFSSCLPAPHIDGFSPGCIESYSAEVHITAYQRQGLSWKTVDTQVLTMAAVEFGGEYMCNGKCPENSV